MYGYAIFGITSETQGYLFDSRVGSEKKLSIPQTNISQFLKTSFSLSYYQSLDLKNKYRILDLLYQPNGYTIIGLTKQAFANLSNERIKNNLIKII